MKVLWDSMGMAVPKGQQHIQWSDQGKYKLG